MYRSIVLSAVFAALVHLSASEVALAFEQRCRELATAMEAEQQIWLAGHEDFLFLLGEVRAAGAGPYWGEAAQTASRASRPALRDPLPAIVDLHRQLAALNIELVVVPVPNRPHVYPDRLPGEPLSVDARLDHQQVAFLAALSAAGVATIDLLPALLAARAEDASAGPVSCRADTHWSPRGAQVVANTIATTLRTRPWYEALPRQTFGTRSETLSFIGDLGQMAERSATESLPATIVVDADGAPITADRSSPILILADSHGLVFEIGGDMFAQGAGLPSHLARELGLRVDVLARRGDAVSTVRRDLGDRHYEDPAWLIGKRIVIWCFAARQGTETNGWQLLSLTE